MKLIPAMSIMRGHVAVAEGRHYSEMRNEAGQFRNPVNVLKDIPGDEAFILDIDGIEGRMPDLGTVKRIAAHREVWLDAGASDADSMMDLFVSGASKVVLGTLSLESLDELSEALDISEDIILSVCCDRGIVSPDSRYSGMSVADFMAGLGDMPGLKSVLLFDVGGLRDCKPPDLEAVKALAGRFGEVFVSGHIDAGDMKTLEEAGAAGLIVDFRKMEVLDGRA